MASIKLSRGSKVIVTGPTYWGNHITPGSTVYAVRYNPSSETWQVSRSKGSKVIASVRRKHLKPVTESETGFKKGDRVQVKSGTVVSSALWGKYGTIQKRDSTGIPFYVKLEGASINGAWFRENEITKVAAKPVAPKFKVGDRVQIKKSAAAVSSMWGKCGKIEKIYSHPCTAPYLVKLEGGAGGWFKESELINPIAPKKTDELTVDADFLKAAHAAACSEWKKKLEKKYPSVFKKPKTWKPKSFGSSRVTFNGDNTKDIFIGLALAPDGLSGKCLMMKADKVKPKITTTSGYTVVSFETLQD